MSAGAQTAHEKGCEDFSKRKEEVRAIIYRTNETAGWDSLKARDLDPAIVSFVEDRIKAGLTPGQISNELGLAKVGGINSTQFRKIMAYFNQGFRADGLSLVVQILNKAAKVNQKLEAILDDAFENGTPVIQQYQTRDPDTGMTTTHTETYRVKGATRELAAFVETYSKSLMTPIKALKEIGAIGEKPGSLGAQGVTIVVENNIPMPSVEEIKAHQAEIRARAQAIEAKSRPVPEVRE